MKRFIFLLLVPIPVTVLAQTETTEWWVDGEVYATTSCETGGDISTPPQNPTKKGHTFQGWESAVYDISTFDATIGGSGYAYDNATHKWRTKFSYGHVYGESLCSSTPPPGSGWYPISQELDTETGSGQYCYCRVTEFLPTGSNKIYEVANSRWVFDHDNPSCNVCTRECGSLLNYNGSDRRRFRENMYGITQ